MGRCSSCLLKQPNSTVVDDLPSRGPAGLEAVEEAAWKFITTFDEFMQQDRKGKSQFVGVGKTSAYPSCGPAQVQISKRGHTLL